MCGNTIRNLLAPALKRSGPAKSHFLFIQVFGFYPPRNSFKMGLGSFLFDPILENSSFYFWYPPLNHLVPQKAISSLFKLSGFSPSRNSSKNWSPILLFCPQRHQLIFSDLSSKMRAGKPSKTVFPKVDLEPYGADW